MLIPYSMSAPCASEPVLTGKMQANVASAMKIVGKMIALFFIFLLLVYVLVRVDPGSSITVITTSTHLHGEV